MLFDEDAGSQAGTQPDAAAPREEVSSNDAVQAGEEEEETCGFCIFMKAGGCREAFVVRYLWPVPAVHELIFRWASSPDPQLQAWSDCVDRERESGGDFTEECRDKVWHESMPLVVHHSRSVSRVLLMHLSELKRRLMMQTFALRDCMAKHKDYYAPVLDAEDEAVQQEAAEKENTANNDDQR